MEAEAKSNSERPRDLRKKISRLKESRDSLKDKSREKAQDIKRLGGKIDDLNESRDMWRTRWGKEAHRAAELEEHNKTLEEALNAKNQLTQQLQAEIDILKKKARI